MAVPIFKWVSSGTFQIFYTHPRYSFLPQIAQDIQTHIQGPGASRQSIYIHDHLYKEQPRTRVRLFEPVLFSLSRSRPVFQTTFYLQIIMSKTDFDLYRFWSVLSYELGLNLAYLELFELQMIFKYV